MIKFHVGNCDLKMSKAALEAFIKNNYLRFYKKDKLRHVTRNDKRLPRLKITDDIFSVQIWFKDKTNTEHRIFVDGSILLDSIKIHTITINKYNLNEFEYNIYIEILKDLSNIAEGYVLISTDSQPQRICKGQIQEYELLLEEMFSNLPKEKQSEVEDLYKWILKANKE